MNSSATAQKRAPAQHKDRWRSAKKSAREEWYLAMGNGGGDRWQSARETPGHVGPELQVNAPCILLRLEPECSARCPLDALPIAGCSKTRSWLTRSYPVAPQYPRFFPADPAAITP